MNKKVSRILLLLLALLSAVSIANATEQREAQRKTGLSFSGTTAYCYANCKSDNHEDKVTANVMLYQGSNVIASWSAQGIGSVTISETAQVKKGYEYTIHEKIGKDFPLLVLGTDDVPFPDGSRICGRNLQSLVQTRYCRNVCLV